MPSIGDKIFSYSNPQLEAKVDRFLRKRPYVDAAPPVDVEVILDRMPEVKNQDVMPILATEYHCEAIVLAKVFMHRHLTVVMDQGIMDQRDPAPYNMAIAEEIGHIELHRAVMLEIQSEADFLELQRHPNWRIAEWDAKYFGRALLMPRLMLEAAASNIYHRVADEIGFGSAFQFSQLFTVRLAMLFEAPACDAKTRIETYVGGLRERLDRSIASRSDHLLKLSDNVTVTNDARSIGLDDPASLFGLSDAD